MASWLDVAIGITAGVLIVCVIRLAVELWHQRRHTDQPEPKQKTLDYYENHVDLRREK